MNRFVVSLGVVILAVACVGPSLIAQEEQSREERREQRRAEQLAATLERFPASDANNDGTLSVEEYRAFQRNRQPNQRNRPNRQAATPTHANVAYGEHPKQRFDLWLAKRDDGKPTPLCIYIHGGGFSGGDKRVQAGTPDVYLQKGISFASMNYRLSEDGKHPYPTAMQDAARGLQFIRSKAGEWNIDADRVVCYGGSAGAGISLWLGFHDDLAKPESDDPIARQSTRILAAGTNDGQSTYDHRTYREWFGVPDLEPHPALVDFYAVKENEDWQSDRVAKLMTDASAITHLTKDDVPVYMTYNRGDVPVTSDTNAGVWVHHVRLGLKLQERMRELGLECVVVSPDRPEERYGDLPTFLIEKLKAE